MAKNDTMEATKRNAGPMSFDELQRKGPPTRQEIDALADKFGMGGALTPNEQAAVDEYYATRPYESRIGAWASSQSEVMQTREEFEKKIKEFKEKYPDPNNVPRPSYWSGWLLKPYKIEFWMDVENRLHQRLCYAKIGNAWHQEILYP